MSAKLLLRGACGLLLCLGVVRHLAATPPSAEDEARSILALRAARPPTRPGSFPPRWINGVNCAAEDDYQVHAYDENTFIIRQGKCVVFEAPFVYLFFGDDRALLMDTGASVSSDIAGVVTEVIEQWLADHGRASIPLTVAHTHHHVDHIAGDNQFNGLPGVDEVVAPNQNAFLEFWGFQNYPLDRPTIDLGNRVLDVLGTPGHHPQSVTLYDRGTQLLCTGDIVYPGHLFVFSQVQWSAFVASIGRLSRFARMQPVEWVVGCHIETSSVPGQTFAWGTSAHPDEHVLQLEPSVLPAILEAALSMNGDPECTIFDDFVIHPVYKCGITWNG